MYANFFKRVIDFILSLIAIIVLSPVLLMFIVIGIAVMKGNPFFLQERPGKIGKDGKEKIFKLIKFRTMTNSKSENGDLLPDESRLVPYGRFLRNTSLDELPSLLNIIKGDISICGPRPLLVKYIPLYSQEQRRRHEVRPGLTGYAQAYGRNSLSWEEKFQKDVYYVDNISLWFDIKIILKTITTVLSGNGITSETSVTMEEFVGSERGEKVNA